MSMQGPLPAVDESSILQRESVRALVSILPLRDYLFRDERVDDYGVDGSLELLADGTATNIRAQVQLKGRSNTKTNQDGSVSIPVRTANLNYLLNGICPTYILYRSEQKEIRFAFARDEWTRLEETNPDWRNQKTITISFRHVLGPDTLLTLRDRIAAAAQLQRQVDERVRNSRSGGGHVVVDAKNLEVLDSRQLLHLLRQIGHLLTNSGLAKIVIERARLIPPAELCAEPEAALEVAYAHFHLAHYYDASATIRQLLLSEPKLDATRKSLLDALFISTRHMLGELDKESYERETAAWLAGAPPDLAIQQEIAEAWAEHARRLTAFGESADIAGVRAALAELLERGRKVGNATVELRCELMELTLEELDVSNEMIDAQALQEFLVYEKGDAHYVRVKLRQSREAAEQWLGRLKRLAETTRDVAPQIYCEALLLRTHAVLGQAMQRHFASLGGYGPPLSRLEAEAILAGVHESLEFARCLDNRELELSAMQFHARALDIFGQRDEATQVATQALTKAELSGCAIHSRQLRRFLQGDDRTDAGVTQLKKLDEMSEEDFLRNASDAELLYRATMQVEARQLPQQRVANALRSLAAQRQLAIERRDWCVHISLAEYRHDSPIMMYADPPLFKIVCSHLRHIELTQAGAIHRLSEVFRRQFCNGCRHRSPDAKRQPAECITPEGRRAKRNQAKAERRRRNRLSR